MRVRTSRLLGAGVAIALGAGGIAAAGGGGGLPRGAEPVTLDPAEFTTRITNPWWPMRPGTRWVYRETEPDGTRRKVVVTVTRRTEVTAAGVRARVVRDTVTEDGALVEDTRDLYAQHRDGTVWYLGERTAEYEDGRVVSTEGSWEAGVDGAQPGIAVPADPEPGTGYRQEYLADEAEDEAVVLSVSEQVEVPAGRYTDALLTRDTTPLEPEVSELKFYVLDVGPVMALQVSGGTSREVLVESTRVG